MEHMASGHRYSFPCNRWLAEDEDDGSIVREMPAEGENIKKPEPRKWSSSMCSGKFKELREAT